MSQANIFEPFIPGPLQQPVLHGDIVKLYKEGGFKLEKISQQLKENQKRQLFPRGQSPRNLHRLHAILKDSKKAGIANTVRMNIH